MLLSSRPAAAAVQAAAKAAGSSGPRGRKAAGKGPRGLGSSSSGGGGGAPKGLGSSAGAAAGAGGGGEGGPPVLADLAAVRAAAAADQAQSAHANALRTLCQGLMHMLLGLAAGGVLAPPPLPFNSAAERFDQRFGSFHIIVRPEVLEHSMFEDSVSPIKAAPAQALSSASALLGKVGRGRGGGQVGMGGPAWLLANEYGGRHAYPPTHRGIG
jgi:hypothetical protein